MEPHAQAAQVVSRNGEPPPGPPRLVSLVIPVFNEADNVVPLLREIAAAVPEPHEVLLVIDDENQPGHGFSFDVSRRP